MNQKEKTEILLKAKTFIIENICNNHKKNIKKLKNLQEFNINPFLLNYLAQTLSNDNSPTNIAKALIYPRALGTSISTTFGTQMQKFCNYILPSLASTTPGIDIEFFDCIDNQRVYCQLKSGPNTINKDDVKTITDHFRKLINLGRTNGLKIYNNQCVVGIIYGSQKELSSSYLNIQKDYTVLIGKDFWEHLTGDANFYNDLIDIFNESVAEVKLSDTLQETIEALSLNLTR